MLRALRAPDDDWDFIVVGGGATGLGVAIDAASRGYRTLLLEQSDFAKGTSSRSTKLIHGGVRYLQQGNVSLVLEALHEPPLRHRPLPRRAPFVLASGETAHIGQALRCNQLLQRREPVQCDVGPAPAGCGISQHINRNG